MLDQARAGLVAIGERFTPVATAGGSDGRQARTTGRIVPGLSVAAAGEYSRPLKPEQQGAAR